MTMNQKPVHHNPACHPMPPPHEPPLPPTGLGVRQPSGALAVVGGRKRQRAGALQNADAPPITPDEAAVQGFKARNFSWANSHPRWFVVVLFAIAMAWVESAVVFDLRTLVDRIEPYQENPLPLIGRLGPVELVRELATMIMLFTVGVLAAQTWRTRLGYMALAFGVWDIFYYAFLKVMCGWPHSLLDWDILFLIPLPWWGPILAPALIALLMVAWGTFVTQFEHDPPPALSNLRVWSLAFIGMALALYVFMADALRVADQGVPVIRQVLPTGFNWLLFSVALALMSAPVIRELPIRWSRRETVAGTLETN
jgi:hypothetical protein